MECLVTLTQSSATESNANAHPRISSYDSGYEHSLEHWLELKQAVNEAAAMGEMLLTQAASGGSAA